jgi:5S rRNA maturation endonuclease (ribonuclease M5)
MLTDEQLAILAARFRHFDADASAPLFHPDQPDGGTRAKREQGRFPAIRMRTGTWWYPDRENRPVRPNTDPPQPMKSEAPAGARPILYDTLDPEELLLVEGEPNAVALRSVGFRGVVAAGGTQVLASRRPQAIARRRAVFQGKSVLVWFDPDEPGREAAPRVARVLLDMQDVRVALVASPFEEGDLEDWLGTFDRPEAALAAVREALGRTQWLEPGAAVEEREEPELVQSLRLRDEDILVAMTYDEEARRPGLAVFAPATEAAVPDYPGQRPEGQPSALRAWRVLDQWEHRGVTYVPDFTGDMQEAIDDRALVLPPPPAESHGTSERLWQDLRAFYRTWVAVPDEVYDAMVAYCLMTYRLEDARFEYVPYLRFSGKSGTGKGRAMDVMRYTCWRSLSISPTAQNLHRLIDYYGDITLFFDEFHLDRGRSREAQQLLLDVLNGGNHRSAGMARVIQEHGRNVVRRFRVFGSKVLAGYGHDEDEGFARRTILVRMGTVPVPKKMQVFTLPSRFYVQARELRARLLAWRGSKLGRGLPDPETERARALLREVGIEIGQSFWPVISMVPEGMDSEMDAIVLCARTRVMGVQHSREVTIESRLLGIVADLWERGQARQARTGGAYVVPTELVAEAAADERIPPNQVGRILKKAGLPHARARVQMPGGERQVQGFVVDAECPATLRTMQHYGIDWPRRRGGDDEEPAL